MGGDTLPIETNDSSSPSRSYYLIWMLVVVWGKEDGPSVNVRKPKRPAQRNTFISSVRRRLNEKELDCTIIRAPQRTDQMLPGCDGRWPMHRVKPCKFKVWSLLIFKFNNEICDDFNVDI